MFIQIFCHFSDDDEGMNFDDQNEKNDFLKSDGTGTEEKLVLRTNIMLLTQVQIVCTMIRKKLQSCRR